MSGRGHVAVDEGTLHRIRGRRAGVEQNVDESNLDVTLPRDPRQSHQTERVVELLSQAVSTRTLRRPQNHPRHLDDVGGQPSVSNRILGDEPEQAGSRKEAVCGVADLVAQPRGRRVEVFPGEPGVG
jgi:hypothetical protein